MIRLNPEKGGVYAPFIGSEYPESVKARISVVIPVKNLSGKKRVTKSRKRATKLAAKGTART